MNWLKFRRVYFFISFALLAIGIISIITSGFVLGLDFRGGTLVEYKLSKEVSTDELLNKLKEKELDIQSVSRSTDNVYLLRLAPVELQNKPKIAEGVKEIDGEAAELRYEVVGASFGPELIQKTVTALTISALLILLWVAIQFKSLKFGVSAVLAMLHDTIILIGSFSVFGLLFKAEVDFLIVTAVLTTLSFSVHDTIVVYDRIREKQKKEGGELRDIANDAINETMVRSLNNSFTIIFMLFALILLGGTTIKWFGVALLIGTIAGTYSSPFVAVPLLVTWDDIVEKLRSGKASKK